MKDSINYFIPIVQDPMNDITGRCINNHVSTNGYYGYQPVVGKQSEAQQQIPVQMETSNDMDIQFNNMIDSEEPYLARLNAAARNNVNRKRTCGYDSDLPDYKKRRENDPLLYIPEQSNNKCLHVRQPTHNIPDMPRCMMEVLHKFKNQRIRQPSGKIENLILFEEMLRETHGVCSYHWLGHDI